MTRRTEILGLVARKLAPFVLLFGCYVISHGHVSPGGGFQGGAVLASGIILLVLGRGVAPTERLLPARWVAFAETCAFCLLLGLGMAGLLGGGRFLENTFPTTHPDEIPTVGFIFALNLVVGLKVGAGISLICLRLFKED